MSTSLLQGLVFPSVSALPLAASNTNRTLVQGGKLWFSDGSVWVDLGAAGSGSTTFGNFTVDFGTAFASDIVIVSVVDAGVAAGTKITLSVGGVLIGRDVDELELAPIGLMVGAITAGVGFDVYAHSLGFVAEGSYYGNYSRN